MELKNISIPLNDDEISIKLISFLDKFGFLKNESKFLDEVCKEIRDLKEEHFGGCSDENEFRDNLKYNLFKDEHIKDYPKERIDLNKIAENISGAVQKIKDIIGKKEILIYVFPTCSDFVAKKLGGVWGLIAWDDILHIFVNPVENWELNLKSTILHELAHCMQDYYTYEMTLFEHLISDGLAEHFQEGFLKGNRNSFTKIISKNDAKKIFRKLKPYFNKTMNEYPEIHSDLFFGSKDYISGTGYTIGYYLIEDYLIENGIKEIDWNKLFSQKPAKFKPKSFFQN